MKQKQLWVGLFLAAVVLPAHCPHILPPAVRPAADTEQETKVPVVAAAKGEVIAEGFVEPARWSELAIAVGGEVVELAVAEGDTVAANALLMRLDTDELEIALQSAQQDVLAGQAALDQLLAGATQAQINRAAKENADAVAQAAVAVQAAKLRLEQTRAEDPSAGVKAAEARIVQLERQVAQIRAQDPASGVAAAEVGLERAQIALDDAQDEYNKALDRPWEDQEIRDAWAEQVIQRKLDVRQAQAQLDGARNARTVNTYALSVVTAQIDEAKIQLEQAQAAQAAYDVALQVLVSDVEAAQLQLEALRTWDNPLLDKATEEEIAQAEARLKQAELAVARLELQIEDATLRAPFAGTVVEVYPESGDEVSAGQAVVVLATLDQLVVRTTDLTELDIAQVAQGQAVVVSVDALQSKALAEREFAGTVSETALRGGDYRGDVVYQVTVDLADVADLPLRWGMTAMVKIDTK